MSVQEMKPIKEGKVREIYDNGDTLIMVATDRISCFDVILDNTVTKKGTVLTQMSKFWFDMTEAVSYTHLDVYKRQPQGRTGGFGIWHISCCNTSHLEGRDRTLTGDEDGWR